MLSFAKKKLPVYFISGADKIISENEINHYNIHNSKEVLTKRWLQSVADKPVEIILTSGASCPDAILDEVLQKIVSYFPDARSVEEALMPFKIESLN